MLQILEQFGHEDGIEVSKIVKRTLDDISATLDACDVDIQRRSVSLAHRAVLMADRTVTVRTPFPLSNSTERGQTVTFNLLDSKPKGSSFS